MDPAEISFKLIFFLKKKKKKKKESIVPLLVVQIHFMALVVCL